MIQFLRAVFAENATKDALVWRDRAFTYADLLARVDAAAQWLDTQEIARGAAVSLEADFSPASVALLLALVERRCLIAPISLAEPKRAEFREVAEIEWVIHAPDGDGGTPTAEATGRTATHPLLTALRAEDRPGLVLFSSGSTGKSKAAVHDFARLLEKFKERRQTKRMISFLLFDHIGGINTLFYVISNAGCLVTTESRAPEDVARTIAKHHVEVLPTSPTFLNLLLLSHAAERHDLSSLELVTYGTEPMPESTLKAVVEAFPKVKLQQTYGLSEIGILRSKSRSSDSLWVKIGGEGFETRVAGGLLEVKAQSAMRGYLNAPSPFTEDGWFKTGDLVEQDGEWFRILGRKSEMINVGGEKVFPAEVESVLQTMPEVLEVVVRGEPNPITGMMVKAFVKLAEEMPLDAFRKKMRAHCKDKLPSFKIPQAVVLKEDSLHTERFKKSRNVS